MSSMMYIFVFLPTCRRNREPKSPKSETGSQRSREAKTRDFLWFLGKIQSKLCKNQWKSNQRQVKRLKIFWGAYWRPKIQLNCVWNLASPMGLGKEALCISRFCSVGREPKKSAQKKNYTRHLNLHDFCNYFTVNRNCVSIMTVGYPG